MISKIIPAWSVLLMSDVTTHVLMKRERIKVQIWTSLSVQAAAIKYKSANYLCWKLTSQCKHITFFTKVKLKLKSKL